MTVYKGYMYIAKKNTGIFLLYLGIFLGITLMFQFMNQEKSTEGYHEESLQIAVVDEDGGEMAEALKTYLGDLHQVTEMRDNASVLQEKMFYRDVDYVVRIPEHFYETCIVKGEKVPVTQVPGSYTSFYAEQQLNSFLNNMRAYEAAGFTEAESARASVKAADVKVELLDTSGNAGETPNYVYYFRYLPYLFLGVLGYVVGSMISSMRRGDLKKRMQASAVSQRRQSIEGLLACATIAMILWGIVVGVAMLFYGKELSGNPENLYYLLNSFAILCVSISIAYLIGCLSKGMDGLNGMVNVVSLGMCFLGGAFVPLDVMSTGVKKAAQFLPVYWFETANELLSGYELEVVRKEVLQAIGIQIVFAVAFVSVTLAVAKRRRAA